MFRQNIVVEVSFTDEKKKQKDVIEVRFVTKTKKAVAEVSFG
jgi:hypothetical protein